MAVNIIIPIKDTDPEYFEQCLYSLATQTKKSFITTVIDDASTEENYQQYLKIIDKMPFNVYTLRNKKNLGPGAARQKAMDMAPAAVDYFFFLDSDDILYPRTVEILLKEIKVREADILVGGILCEGEHRSQDSIIGTQIIAGWSTGKLFRRKFLENNNIRFLNKNIYAEDSYFGLVAHNFTKNIYYINEIIYYWRNNPNSITRRNNYEFIDKNNLDHFISQYEGAKTIFAKNPDWNFGGILQILYSCYQYSKEKKRFNEIQQMDIMLENFFSYPQVQEKLETEQIMSTIFNKLLQYKDNCVFHQTCREWLDEQKEKYNVV